MQIPLIAIPPPATIVIDRNVDERIELEFLDQEVSFRVPAVPKVSMPQMEETTLEMSHIPSHRLEERFSPFEIMISSSGIHASRPRGIIEPPQQQRSTSLDRHRR